MSAETECYRIHSRAVFAYGKWHHFGDQCAHRVTGQMRKTFSVVLVAPQDINKKRGEPTSPGALMIAMYREERCESYEK
jgi:hypothetical protein